MPSRTAGRLFGNAVVVFLGNISFSIYLIHIFVLGCLAVAIDSLHINTGDWLARLVASAVYLPLVLVTAYVTWRFIERPTHEFARRHGRDFTSRTLAWFGSWRSLPDRSMPAPATLTLWTMRIVAMSLGVTRGRLSVDNPGGRLWSQHIHSAGGVLRDIDAARRGKAALSTAVLDPDPVFHDGRYDDVGFPLRRRRTWQAQYCCSSLRSAWGASRWGRRRRSVLSRRGSRFSIGPRF